MTSIKLFLAFKEYFVEQLFSKKETNKKYRYTFRSDKKRKSLKNHLPKIKYNNNFFPWSSFNFEKPCLKEPIPHDNGNYFLMPHGYCTVKC